MKQEYAVSGLTCGHCVSAVTAEFTALDGVHEVHTELRPGATSTVIVTTDRPLLLAEIASALDMAGGYRLVSH